ncbi:AAA family ATPase [Candidatus Saccharibacteria bacterium]|nr:AAA family ATPase [Candidatus Saccharibacteria bacterium]
MKLPEIVGIAGASGAGKDTTGHLLAKFGYKFTSISDTLRAELDVQGKEHTRENMRGLSSQWHREFGPEYLTKRTIALYREEKEGFGYTGLAIGSVRRPSEAQVIQADNGMVLWLDADRRVRFERIQAAHRGRAEDAVTFEQWCIDEDAEMTPPLGDDGSALNMAGVRDIADVSIDNSFEDERHFDVHVIELFELSA